MKIEHTHESAWWDEGKRYVIGLDEAGRGPIAGPLVVAGVCFPPHYAHEEIYDSKKLSEKTRERLYDEILAQAIETHIVIVEPQIIDERTSIGRPRKRCSRSSIVSRTRTVC